MAENHDLFYVLFCIRFNTLGFFWALLCFRLAETRNDDVRRSSSSLFSCNCNDCVLFARNENLGPAQYYIYLGAITCYINKSSQTTDHHPCIPLLLLPHFRIQRPTAPSKDRHLL